MRPIRRKFISISTTMEVLDRGRVVRTVAVCSFGYAWELVNSRDPAEAKWRRLPLPPEMTEDDNA